jgi:hypothetical protein
MDVAEWLSGFGFAQYAPAFRENSLLELRMSADGKAPVSGEANHEQANVLESFQPR